MVAAQDVIVRTDVVATVRVVRPPETSSAATVLVAVLFVSARTSLATALPVGATLASAVMAVAVSVEFRRRKWKCL